MNNNNLQIRAVDIQEHYEVISDMMRELHASEKELFDKTTTWDDIEQSYMQHVIESAEEGDGTFLIAYINGKPAGFIFGYLQNDGNSRIEQYTGDDLYVSDGFIYPQYRRSGIYKQLNAMLEEIYINKGVRRVLRYTLVSNTRMQHFLNRHGYEPVRLFYEKWLEPDGRTVKPLTFTKPKD